MEEIIDFYAGVQFELFTVYLLHELKVPWAFWTPRLQVSAVVIPLWPREQQFSKGHRVLHQPKRPRMTAVLLITIRVSVQTSPEDLDLDKGLLHTDMMYRSVPSRSAHCSLLRPPTRAHRSFWARPAHWCHYARSFNPYSIALFKPPQLPQVTIPKPRSITI